jgi:hypothetical protein
MKLIIKWFEYPTNQGSNGSGGWSKNAKHRPQPVVMTKIINGPDFSIKGKSVYFNGIRKLKCNVWGEDGGVIRKDYAELNYETI